MYNAGRMTRCSLLPFVLVLVPACEMPPESRICTNALDDLLRLEDLQAKGSHNSYHIEPASPVDDSHRYTHATLATQLEEQGVRQFELDLHYRSGEGFEVFHLPYVDEETTCRRFVDCMAEIRAWSDENNCHMPLLIWLEPKDEADDLDRTLEPISEHYEDLESEILSVWPSDRILWPDELRRSHDTLPEAIAAEGWPTLGELRGRVIFAMLDSGEHREAYTSDAPNLAGRLLFVDSDDPSDSYAAVFKINNAQNDAEEVRGLLEAGFVITSNVDGADRSDDENRDRSSASLEAGSNYLSTDYPAPATGRRYWFRIPDGSPARCNPLVAPGDCLSEHIESLE